jgi:hypothetical protein
MLLCFNYVRTAITSYITITSIYAKKKKLPPFSFETASFLKRIFIRLQLNAIVLLVVFLPRLLQLRQSGLTHH